MSLTKERTEESLEVIRQVFPDIYESCTKGYFGIDTKRLSDIREILRCIEIYKLLKGMDDLRGRKQEVLAYYLMLGYSKKTKESIMKELDIKSSNLNHVNHSLRKMGAIRQIGYNESNNEVNKELIKLKEFIVDGRNKYILIKID